MGAGFEYLHMYIWMDFLFSVNLKRTWEDWHIELWYYFNLSCWSKMKYQSTQTALSDRFFLRAEMTVLVGVNTPGVSLVYAAFLETALLHKWNWDTGWTKSFSWKQLVNCFTSVALHFNIGWNVFLSKGFCQYDLSKFAESLLSNNISIKNLTNH